ncbi:hypothetical protein [Azospirillum argentinense]
MINNAENPKIIRTRSDKIRRTVRIIKNHIMVCSFDTGH